MRLPFRPRTSVMSHSGCRRSITELNSFRGNGLQFCVSAVLERHFAHVTAQIKLRVVFPTGKPKTERRGHNTLEIARKQRQF